MEFIGSSRRDLRALPKEVRFVFGYAILLAEWGGKHPDAKPLKGFGSAGVLEVIENYAGDAYRAIYTIKFDGVIYVLHAFQKKAKKGTATPQKELELIRQRLRMAQEHYEENYRSKKTA